jgi:hypothetical protein
MEVVAGIGRQYRLPGGVFERCDAFSEKRTETACRKRLQQLSVACEDLDRDPPRSRIGLEAQLQLLAGELGSDTPGVIEPRDGIGRQPSRKRAGEAGCEPPAERLSVSRVNGVSPCGGGSSSTISRGSLRFGYWPVDRRGCVFGRERRCLSGSSPVAESTPIASGHTG